VAQRAWLWAIGLVGCSTAEVDVAGPTPVVPTSDWTAQAFAGIAVAERQPAEVDGGFRLSSRAGGLVATVGPHGARLGRRAVDAPEPDVGLRTVAFGRGDTLRDVGSAAPDRGACFDASVDAFGDCLRRVERDDDGIVEWWAAADRGLEHGWTVSTRPAGTGPLRVRVAVDGDLTASGADALEIRGVTSVVQYAELRAWDATGAPLDARFVVADAGFDVVVDDEAARYPIEIDPLASTAGWSTEPNDATSEFGGGVASAGDVNGDGYGDVVVGAPILDAAGYTTSGKAFVYYGGASGLSTTAAWSHSPTQTDAGYGASVASAGDINGDGYGDLLVGAWKYDGGATNSGAVYVYHGSASGLPSGYTRLLEAAPEVDGWLGHSVSSAGDVNGDGYSDIVSGCERCDAGQSNEGVAYVWMGGPSGLGASPGWTGQGDYASGFYGASVTGAGDLNGDGYSDIAVGHYRFANGNTNEGRVVAYFGSSGGLATSPSWTYEANVANYELGNAVEAAGDVNGDGYADLVAGASLGDGGQSNEGQVYVFPGGASTLGSPWVREIDTAAANLGFSVGGGDVNGDGFSDVIAGATGFTGSGGTGWAGVWMGSASGPLNTPVVEHRVGPGRRGPRHRRRVRRGRQRRRLRRDDRRLPQLGPGADQRRARPAVLRGGRRPRAEHRADPRGRSGQRPARDVGGVRRRRDGRRVRRRRRRRADVRQRADGRRSGVPVRGLGVGSVGGARVDRRVERGGIVVRLRRRRRRRRQRRRVRRHRGRGVAVRERPDPGRSCLRVPRVRVGAERRVLVGRVELRRRAARLRPGRVGRRERGRLRRPDRRRPGVLERTVGRRRCVAVPRRRGRPRRHTGLVARREPGDRRVRLVGGRRRGRRPRRVPGTWSSRRTPTTTATPTKAAPSCSAARRRVCCPRPRGPSR
jgi:hypothetical protein